MPRGPKPKPTVADTARGRRATDEDRSPPPEVEADARSLVAWHDAVASLEAVGLFHRADRAIIARYAVLTSHYLNCLEDIRSHGMSMATSTGYQAPSPAATNLLKVASQLTGLEGAMGLTPRSRANMKVAAPTADEEEEAELRRFTG